MKNFVLILITIFSLSLSCCQKAIFQEGKQMDAISVFTQIWKDFDENYGLFDVKHINWDSIYQSIVPTLNQESNAFDLYQKVVKMLKNLNDKHITLFPASNPELPRWGVDLDDQGIYHNDVFDFNVIRKNYLEEVDSLYPYIQFGRLNSGSGYIRFQHMDGNWKSYERSIDKAFEKFSQDAGIIIDLRDCAGGYDPVSQYVAGRFCKNTELYMTVRKKNGIGHNDFGKTEEYFITPTGERQFTKPIILLTSYITASAGESLTLALKTQNHIIHIGEITSGNFSDNPMWESSNGWSYTISVGDYRDHNGESLEEKGISPDQIIESDKVALKLGRDIVLEKAIEILQD